MRRNFLSEAQKYIAKNRRRRIWKDIVIVLACIVVFCTTYALILPAITVEQQDVNQVVGDAEYQNDETTGEGTSTGDNTDTGLGDSTSNENTSIDFKKYITSIKLQRMENGNWVNIENNTVVKKDDQLNFIINYTLEKGVLNGSSTITYQLPDNFIIQNEQSGNVRSSSGTKVGTYVIKTTGEIEITFDNDYVSMNGTSEITGSIEFDTSADKIKFNEQGQSTIIFKDGVTVNLEKDKITTSDLKVEKTAAEPNNTDGTVRYTIVVSSENGTNGKTVKLEDIMKNIAYDGNFTVLDKNNNKVENIIVPDKGSEKFNITLPAMGEKDEYTITYTAKVKDELFNNGVDANNKVTVTDEDKLEDESSVDTKFTGSLIKKVGNLSNGKITWTITVNERKRDIGDFILRDILNGVELEDKEVSISPAIEGKDKITLPYKFPKGSTDTYTITYTTDADTSKDLGKNQAINNAKLDNPDPNGKDVSTGDVWQWIGGEVFDPLNKKAEEIKYNGDTSIIGWTISIDTTKGEIPAEWKLTDTLDNYNDKQWFTSEQREAIESKFKTLDSDCVIDWNKSNMTINGQTKEYYTGFEVTFKKALSELPKEEDANSIDIYYEATGELGEEETTKVFKNKVNINGKVEKSAEVRDEYKPVVSKYDYYNQGKEETSHSYNKDGTLNWGFKVNIPENVKEQDVIITENLPKGLYLPESNGLKVKVDNIETEVNFNNQGIAIVNIQGYENYDINFTKSIDGNGKTSVVINIPKDLVKAENFKSKELEFIVRAKIDENYNWTTVKDNGYIASFKNEVVVKTEDNQLLGQADQTQNIKHEILNKSYGNITDNIIPYSVEINKDAKDLLQGSDTLTLTDVLKYEIHDGWPYNVSLVPNSLKVYEIDADGNKVEINPIKYTYDIDTITENGNKVQTCTLSVNIPDNKHLKVEYEYKASAQIGFGRGISNSVSLNGNSEESFNSNTSIYVTITKSSAIADVEGGINIHKIDSDNAGELLEGAKFNLEYYDVDSKAYIPVKEDNQVKIFTTNEEGKIYFKPIYNTAYRLKEIEAPTGYVLNSEYYYFCVGNSDKTKYPEKKPEDFNGHEYAQGSVIYITNKMDITEITVNKKWFINGQETNNVGATEISFQLMQRASTKNTDGTSLEIQTKIYGEYKILRENDWQIVIDKLPKQGIIKVKNDSGEITKKTVYYTYYVKEQDFTNYEAAYDNNKGITEGTITITNTLEENPEYVLPETGRFGGDILFILGGMLLMAGSLVYIYKRKHKRV